MTGEVSFKGSGENERGGTELGGSEVGNDVNMSKGMAAEVEGVKVEEVTVEVETVGETAEEVVCEEVKCGEVACKGMTVGDSIHIDRCFQIHDEKPKSNRKSLDKKAHQRKANIFEYQSKCKSRHGRRKRLNAVLALQVLLYSHLSHALYRSRNRGFVGRLGW